MGGEQATWLVTNASSGSNSAEANARLQEALEQAGWAPARTADCAQDDLPDLAALTAAGVRRLVCHTGDGTLNALITAIEGWDGELLVLPGGTTNLLSKALHGDLPAEDIVARARHLVRRRRPCIRSAQGTALIEVLAGPGAKWSDVREGLREGDLAEAASKAVEATRESAAGSMVRLSRPPLGKPEGYAGVRLTPFEEGLEVEGYGADTIADYFKQGVALLKRDFREGPHDELGRHRTVRCTSVSGEAIELMFDGERHTGDADIEFSLAELDLDLLALT